MLEPLLEVCKLKKYFAPRSNVLRSIFQKEKRLIHAVDDVSFQISSGEVLGLIGESGCGKTTIGRVLVRLLEPTDGKVLFKGIDLTSLADRQMKEYRKKTQMIFQDPYESLNPRMSIHGTVAEPINIQKIASSHEEEFEIVSKILEELDLTPAEEFLFRYPHELSGGQRQRVAIARAFVLEPEFVVADEPTSMLDASTRSEVLDLILRLIEKTKCGFLYITHDIALTRHICNRVAIMYLGRIVEIGQTDVVIQKYSHPYTKALLAAVPIPDPTARRAEAIIGGEVPSAINLPSGCRFHPRCIYAHEICRTKEPGLVHVNDTHYVACHFPVQ